MVRYTPLYASRTKDRVDAKGPRKGDPLRDRKSPSVSDLLARRAEAMGRDVGGSRSMDGAKNLAVDLAYWDAGAARPVLRSLARRCNDLIAGKISEHFGGQKVDEAECLAEITTVRGMLGDAEALADYAEMLPQLTPDLGRDRFATILGPMMGHPNDPAIVRAAEAMFLEPSSPWLPLLGDARHPDGWYGNDQLIKSPLTGVAAFRTLLIRALADRTPIGYARLDEKGQALYRMSNGGSGGVSPSYVDPEGPKSTPEVPMRACDYLALTLTGALDGLPPVMPFWPEDRRDRAIADQVAFLQCYGERFAVSPLRDGLVNRVGRSRQEPVFPPLDHPATVEDVRRGLAIFTLEGRGPARIVPMLTLPLPAKWTTLKDYAYQQQSFSSRTNTSETKIVFDQDGLVWQAEEVEEEGRWRRYYGFAGRRLDRVPAEEIEFPEPWNSWALLNDKFDAQLAPVPERPRTFVVRLRNRGGLPREVPTSFLALDRLALRPGVILVLSYTPDDAQARMLQGIVDTTTKWEDLAPKSTAQIEPDRSTRSLAPAEAFDAFTFRLEDWFDASRPGTYRLRVKLAAEAGLGEGSTQEVRFLLPSRSAVDDLISMGSASWIIAVVR